MTFEQFKLSKVFKVMAGVSLASWTVLVFGVPALALAVAALLWWIGDELQHKGH